jgi:hypothetical protein
MVGDQFLGRAADSLATEFAIPVLARIPFHPANAVWSDLAARL